MSNPLRKPLARHGLTRVEHSVGNQPVLLMPGLLSAFFGAQIRDYLSEKGHADGRRTAITPPRSD